METPFTPPPLPPPASPSYYTSQEPLPKAMATMVLGIITLVSSILCCCVPLPPVLGIIAVVLGYGDRLLYKSDPRRYTEASYSNLKAGLVCAIVGLVIFGIACIVMVIAAILDPDSGQKIDSVFK